MAEKHDLFTEQNRLAEKLTDAQLKWTAELRAKNAMRRIMQIEEEDAWEERRWELVKILATSDRCLSVDDIVPLADRIIFQMRKGGSE